ncbi:MAG TPA: AI-2E family transporter [Candidatus Syntrophosphaera sp.]|nr:AI-2E family transporter [Candidatus Syntrophosphaera sp.]
MNWTRVIYILLLLAVLVGAAVFYSPVLLYLLISVVVSYILDPLITWLEYKRVPRWAGVLLVYAVIGGAVAWGLARFVPRLIQEGNQFINLVNKSGQPLSDSILSLPFFRSAYEFSLKLDARIPTLQLAEKFLRLIESGAASLGELPQLLFKNYQTILSTIALIFTIPVFSFFILKDSHSLRKAILSLAPNRYFELSLILLNKIDESVGRYLRAILLEVIAVSLMSMIALTIVGVPYAILIGITSGITNIIPYIGPWIGGALAALTVLVTGLPPVMIIWVALAMFLVQALDNYMVYPVVVGKTIRMHPLVVLLTVFAGGYFGGVIWMLISVPVVFMVYSLVSALHNNLKRFRML